MGSFLLILPKENKFNWITRIPNSLKESKKLLSKSECELNWEKTEKDYKYSVHESSYGNIAQKWLLIFSDSKYKKDRKKLLEKYKKEKSKAEKNRKSLLRKLYKSEEEIKETVKKSSKKLKYFKLSISKIEKEERGKKGEKKEIYKLKLLKLDRKLESIKTKIRTLGRFILGTNDVEEKYQSMSEILDLYKSQQNVERGFRFLKDPWFMVDDFYLKKPERIESLVVIMTLTLFVYNYGQHKLRKALETRKETLPNQKSKEISKPTLKWIFQLMQGVSVLLIRNKNDKTDKIVTNIDSVRRKIIFLMSNRAPEIYKLEPTGFT